MSCEARVEWLRLGQRPKLEKFWLHNVQKVLSAGALLSFLSLRRLPRLGVNGWRQSVAGDRRRSWKIILNQCQGVINNSTSSQSKWHIMAYLSYLNLNVI